MIGEETSQDLTDLDLKLSDGTEVKAIATAGTPDQAELLIMTEMLEKILEGDGNEPLVQETTIREVEK